ncbi:MAG TPA: MarR family transcriptional regulator [Solirubrobacteraceae bacterium]|nr:MarR family transcriptional regulator [Solirubrobacteraceae bacterium]
MALCPEHLARLRDELGVSVAAPGLTPIETRVLAALRDAPLGLASARAVARRAGVSPTAASRALKTLEGKSLVRREPTVLAAGRARRVELLHADRLSPRWDELTPLLAHVRPPARRPVRDTRVPVRLRHLFWNTASAQLTVERGGPYIARRLLSTMDLDGLAWGARNLRASDWAQAQKARGLEPGTRALARNLAAQAAP